MPSAATRHHQYTLDHSKFWTVVSVNAAAVLERCDEQLLPAVYNNVGASLQAGPTQLGLITLARALVQAAASPAGGLAGHCLHRGAVIGCGCCLWATSVAAFAACHGMAGAVLSWGANGLGLALVLSNTQALTADLFPGPARGRAFGLLWCTSALGGMAGAVFATNLGGRRLLGVEGWRMTFLALAAASAAVGLLNLLATRDPRRPGSKAALRHGRAVAEEPAAPEDDGKEEAAAARATLARLQLPVSGALGEAGQAMASLLRVPTFQLIVAQGVFGSIPWAALAWLTLYFQLVGMSDAAASALVALFMGATALGGLLGGWVGDAAAQRWPHHGRLAAAQLSVAAGPPFAVLLIWESGAERSGIPLGLPRNGNPATVAIYAAVLLTFALLKAWPAPAFNNPAFAEVVPAHHRSLIYALDRALETALAAGAAPLVGALASRAFHFSGSASVSGDRAQDLANAGALGQALLAFTVLPWGITLLLFTLLHWSYPQDRARAAAAEAAAADERTGLLPPGPPSLAGAEACAAAARGGSGVLELGASAPQGQSRAERQASV